MKSFYEMLRILESEQVKTPGGYTLTPEELEEYENEKSSMYKALFLKDIDAKRKAEEENRPERIAAREIEIKRQEDEKERQQQEERDKLEKIKQKERYNALPSKEKYDYIIKTYGIMLDAYLNGSSCCKHILAFLVNHVNQEGSQWKWTNKFTKESFTIEPHNEFIGPPKYEKDFEEINLFMMNLMVNYSEYISENKKFCADLNNSLSKIGIKSIYKLGDIVEFEPSLQMPMTGFAETGDKVKVVEGYDAGGFSPIPTFNEGLVWEKARSFRTNYGIGNLTGNIVLFRAAVDPV